MNINDTINLMKKINNQNNAYIKGNDYNASSMVSSPTPSVKLNNKQISPYEELVKEALYNNFMKVAGKLRLNGNSKSTGANFIQSVIDKSADEVNKAHYQNLTPAGKSTSVLEYNYACVIDQYAKELRQVNYEVNGIQGFKEDSDTLAHKGIIDRFNDTITKYTPDKINNTIADRVEKATSNFIGDRNAQIERIKDIYQRTKSFIANPKFSDEAKERVQAESARQIAEIRKEKKSLFAEMIEELANATMKSPALQARYMKESSGLDMDAIIDDTAAIYTVLEECNVYGLLDADKVATAYINSLKEQQ